MKTSLSALTGKRCGPEISDPEDIENKSFESQIENAKFSKNICNLVQDRFCCLGLFSRTHAPFSSDLYFH